MVFFLIISSSFRDFNYLDPMFFFFKLGDFFISRYINLIFKYI